MERYHILKLGLAITFYAVYCIRPMLVYSLQTNNNNKSEKNSDRPFEYFRYYQGVDGAPGVDYPVYSYIPKTSFSCKGIESGYYADLDTDCQVFHICQDQRKISFLCPNGTIFQQSDLICEWWNKVNCSNSPNLYEESAERLQNDIAKRKASRRVSVSVNHRAVIRTEERISIRATKNGRPHHHRIPKNNEIEQQIIEQAESDNRHLARAQQQSFLAKQQHNNNNNNNNIDENKRNESLKRYANRTKQFKKDVDRETGNYFNTNYERTKQERRTQEYHKQYNSFSDQKSTNNNAIFSPTPATVKKSTKPIYGTTLKERFNSYEARRPEKNDLGNSQSSSRGNAKYGSNSVIIVPTTYSPLKAQEKYPLPAFPTHKSEEIAGQIKVVIQSSDEANANSDSAETQIPQESSSFVKNPYNSITDDSNKATSPYPNHRSTYSDIKDLRNLEPPKVSSSIRAITPYIVTTQPINNGKPFIGSQVGHQKLTTKSKFTYLPTTPRTTVIFGVLRHRSTTPGPFDNPSFTGNDASRAELNTGVTGNPIKEPPFIKKSVSLLYNNNNNQFVTEKVPAQSATVYGTYSSSTHKYTPYSPTVPTVTKILPNIENYSTTPRSAGNFNQVNFNNGQNRVSLRLSKNVGGQSSANNNNNNNNQRGVNTKVGASFRVMTPIAQTEMFYASKPRSKLEKPRPFSRNNNDIPVTLNPTNENKIEFTTFPSYRISSSRPFQTTEATQPTPFSSTTILNDVYNNLDNMIEALRDLAKYRNGKKFDSLPRPSGSEETLYHIVQYVNDLEDGKMSAEGKEKLTTLLTAMTIHGYNRLFNSSSVSDLITTAIPESTTVGSSISDSGIKTADETTSFDELLPSTSLPELRQLARNFSLALSSYLNDPVTFRKGLESLRPTEPSSLDGTDIAESSTTEDELLNFSDTDLKPTSPPTPSATWGYILPINELNNNNNKGIQDEVKNSLNPDLNTADSQSFIPGYNNIKTEEKSTALPVDHWTGSSKAVDAWKKALSVNPVVVNDEFDETPSSSSLSSESSELTTELFNTAALSDVVAPQSEIKYEIRQLPSLSLNSTQVHGLLINFMNSTRSDSNSRLYRILRKLNTTEEEFLNRMKEIETNPLTKRLVLLLISECGANITEDLGSASSNQNPEKVNLSNDKVNLKNHSLDQLIHPHLNEDNEDSRALHLLNSLYSIASKFGKKR